MSVNAYRGCRIDAHAHAGVDRHLDRAVAFLGERRLRWHNVAGSPRYNAEFGRMDVFRRMHEVRPDLFAWGTGFPAVDTRDPHYIGRVLRQLETDFAAGATCCKFWRDIGMSVRKPDGSYLLIDDPYLEPIFSFLEAGGKTALMHIGEPYARWPSFPAGDPRGRIFSPLSREYAAVDFPGFREQMRAQENVIRRHPRLRFVGAHLAGLDYDVGEVAGLLDRCPNLAVDTSGRRRSLAVQDSATVRDFIIRYQDRILWGMDQGNGKPVADMSPDEEDRCYRALADGYGYEFGYYERSGPTPVDQLQAQGLALPAAVLDKIYGRNVRAWYPGIFPAGGPSG